MAIKRTSSNSLVNATKMSTGFSSAAIPNAPTIGTATATSDVAATVTYTAAVLGATGTTFTATSNPSSITGTGSSPITVTGLTASTAYTFTVTAGNANGTSAASSASNSITTSAPLSSYESIATVSVGSGGQANIEFTSIPSTFTHLQIRGIIQTNRATYGRDVIFARFNGDTGNNYAFHLLQGDGSAPYATGGGTKNKIEIEGAGTTAGGSFGAFVIDILDYANTNKYKTLRALSGVDHNGTIAGYGGVINLVSGLWQNTNAITSIKFQDDTGDTLQNYSTLALYGIKGA